MLLFLREPARKERFPRTLANLSAAIRELPCVLVFDNSDLPMPFRHVAVFANGRRLQWNEPAPPWLQTLGAEEIKLRQAVREGAALKWRSDMDLRF